MRKYIILILMGLILTGCSSSQKEANKIFSCEYTSTEDDIEIHSTLVANYNDSELLTGTFTSEMTYKDESVAKAVYKIYEGEEDDTHNVEISRNGKTVTMVVRYPDGSDASYFADQLRSLTWKGACKKEIRDSNGNWVETNDQF